MKRAFAAFLAIVALAIQPAQAGDGIRTSAQPLNTAVSNAALTFDLFGSETLMGVEITGLTASGATLTIEGSTDARPNNSASKVWFSTVAIPFTCPSPSTFTTVNADGPFKFDTSGLTNVRFRVSSTGTGTALISINAIPASTLGSCGGTGGGSSGGNVNIHDSAGNALTSTGGALNVAGTFSATLGGFTPSSSGARMAPLTVQVTDSSQTLPTGAVSVVSNVGTTNPMYCNVNGVAATTADQLISPSSWFAFTIPATITTLHCIATGGTTSADAVGGAGLPTGAGGGGGGGGTFTWPGTAGVAAGGTSAGSNTMPYVNNYQVNAIPAGSNTIGTVNLGTVGGIATAANQEVTVAGTTATSAQGVQGVTGGVPQPTIAGPNVTTTGNITVQDAGQTCTSTNWGNQTACTGTPTAGSALQVAVSSAGYLWLQGVVTSGAPTANYAFRISNDGGTTWFNRGIFTVTSPSPMQINNLPTNFAGWMTGGVTNVEVIATTYAGGGTTAITITQGQATPFVTSSATSSSTIGVGASAATVIQGAGTSGLPINTDAQQQANVALAPPTGPGVSTSGNIPAIQGVSGGVPIPVSGSLTASFSQFAPNGTYSTPLTVGATSARTPLPSGPTVAIYNAGSNAAFVQLGNSSVVATAANDQVAPGGFLCLAIGSSVDIAAIETAGATTLNISGGSGGCAGSGGGGGGGSSGNVFQATAFANGSTSSSATTQEFPLSGSTVIYLVNYAAETDAAASAPATFQIVAGTGSNCASSQTALTPVWNFSANNGIQEGSIGVLGASAAGAELCVKTTTTNQVNWRIGVVQQ